MRESGVIAHQKSFWSLSTLLMVRSSLQSLGRNIELDASGGLNTTYPLYAIPVPAFLELNEWVPHQDLVAQGKVIEIVDATKQDVLFCSHQWVSFEHPDPASEQLHALQLVIKKLMAGKTGMWPAHRTRDATVATMALPLLATMAPRCLCSLP